jgi:hypothetical protein
VYVLTCNIYLPLLIKKSRQFGSDNFKKKKNQSRGCHPRLWLKREEKKIELRVSDYGLASAPVCRRVIIHTLGV